MNLAPATGRRRRRAEVNIVPLVDVLLVLIFFFVMTMQFRQPRVLNLELPEIETAGVNQDRDFLRLVIDPEGAFYLNEQPVNRDELRAALQVAGQANPDQPVLLAAHEETPLRILTEVMDWSRTAGLDSLRIQSREEARGEPSGGGDSGDREDGR
jgi:biopolymer transport protein ExbD